MQAILEHLEKVLKQDRAFKIFKLYVIETVYEHSQNPLETPRELMLLYNLFLEAESPGDLRKLVKLCEKLSLAGKYPWLKQVISETEKMIQELEKLEEEELELKIKELL